MRLRDYLLMGGAFALFAASFLGCETTKSNVRTNDTSRQKVVNTTNDESIDNKVASTDNGDVSRFTGNGGGSNFTGNGDSDANGTGPDPLYQLVEETIGLYNAKGEPISVKKNPNGYISLMKDNLERLAGKDLPELAQEQKNKLAEAFSDFGLALRVNKQYSQAIQKYELAASLTSNRDHKAVILHDWGVTLFYAGKPKDAWEKIEESLKIKPDYGEALKSKRFLQKKYDFS